jgi:hypothetical protein
MKMSINIDQVSAPGGGNGDPQRQDAGPSGARTGMQRIQPQFLEKGVFEATGAGFESSIP